MEKILAKKLAKIFRVLGVTWIIIYFLFFIFILVLEFFYRSAESKRGWQSVLEDMIRIRTNSIYDIIYPILLLIIPVIVAFFLKKYFNKKAE